MSGLLQVREMSAGYGPVRVLHKIDMEVAAGEVLAVLGANGAGKTTLLRALSSMIPATGTISFQDHQVQRLSTHNLARRGMAHVPEHRGTFAELTVEENLELGSYGSRQTPDEKRAARGQIYGFFPRLLERRAQQAGSLSGGEQQMLAIGRALALKPCLLLLDEPSFGLAPQTVQEIYSILRILKSEHQVAMVLVEQHAGLALDIADRAVVLASGRVVLDGSSSAVRNNPGVRESYFGEGHG